MMPPGGRRIWRACRRGPRTGGVRVPWRVTGPAVSRETIPSISGLVAVDEPAGLHDLAERRAEETEFAAALAAGNDPGRAAPAAPTSYPQSYPHFFRDTLEQRWTAPVDAGLERGGRPAARRQRSGTRKRGVRGGELMRRGTCSPPSLPPFGTGPYRTPVAVTVRRLMRRVASLAYPSRYPSLVRGYYWNRADGRIRFGIAAGLRISPGAAD